MVASIGAMTITAASSCSHITKRGQSPDTEGMEFNEKLEHGTYVGDVSGPIGLDKLKVEGLGLVTGLDGTGSDPPPSPQRDFLVDDIETHEIENVSELLADLDNSMVQILGFVPPGAQRGDRFDLVVQCMPKSKTKSLEGGFLLSSRIKPLLVTSRSVQMGHNTAIAEGRVLVDRVFDSRDGDKNLVSGIIPGGGVVTRDRETGLQLVDTARSIQNATSIARACNARFRTRVGGTPEGVANPVTDRRLEILIPDEYRHNIGRYFHVILNIVFDETADQRINRLELLERQLHNPPTTSISAIRLEAIGDEGKGALKRGLRSDDFQVQFHAAQALAYMRDNSGVEILKRAVQVEPAFRWHGLSALASIRDGTSEQALTGLFDSESAEARYGAFRALRESMPGSPTVDGDFVNREFMLHRVASQAEPMVHFSRTRTPEIVLFGGEHRFNEKLLYVDKGLTIRAAGPDEIQILRYQARSEPQRRTCSTQLADVFRSAAAIGCDYGDLLKLVRDATNSGAIDSRLVVNALPQLNRSYRAGVEPGESAAETSDTYISEEMPEMFDDAEKEPTSKPESRRWGLFGKLKGTHRP